MYKAAQKNLDINLIINVDCINWMSDVLRIFQTPPHHLYPLIYFGHSFRLIKLRSFVKI